MSAVPVDLRVDYDTAPENATPDAPRFSWRCETGGAQTAYRVLVGRDAETVADGVGDLWDSGRVESGRSVHVTYDGAPLAPDETYTWTVQVWDEAGEASGFAAPETFGTALAEPREWQGIWIGHQPDPGDSAGWRSDWVPAEEADEEWVQVDLGGLEEFSAIEFDPTNAANVLETPDGGAVRGQFGFPLGYRVEVANDPDFEDARTLIEVEDRDDQRGTREYDVGPVAGRYVRITATDMHVINPIRKSYRDHDIEVGVDEEPFAAFALSRLAVLDDGVDLAREQPVRASSTVEGGHWGAQHLVDGTHGIHDAATSPLLRSEVTLRGPVADARLHVTAVGYGEAYVNGEKLGDAVLDPGWTNYQDRVLIRTHDVADRLEEGDNALGLWLGRGWYTKWGRGSPRAIAHLSVTYEDGTTKVWGSDGTWRATDSPIESNDIYDGETYDARAAEPGWAEVGFDDVHWDGAEPVDPPGGELEPQRTVPIRVAETLEPDDVREFGHDTHIVDFGQNHTGWVELDVTGASEGDEIVIEHAEVLDDEGDLETTDLRSADATDRYVASGDEGEGPGMDNTGDGTYEPRFTYHGYRYAKVSGYPGELTPEDVTAKVVHTDFDSIGHFDCSNEDLAQVQHNAEWGLRSNSHSIPTDCPQRNERLGWTGDAQLAGRSLMYNFDASGFHEKWMRDHDDAQSRAGYLPPVVPPRHRLRVSDPSWTVTRVVIPYYLYLHYGDEQVLADHYEQMCRYVDYWHGVAEEHVVPEKYGDYGDWLAFENNDGRRGLPFDLFNTAFHYQTTRMVGEIADLLGAEADAERYGERAERIADAFMDRFYRGDGRFDPHIQSAYAITLHLGIAPAAEEDAILETLVEKVEGDGGQLRTGFLGTRALINTLADHGEGDLAYEIVSQPEKPGWVYMVRQGATTMWERWDSDDRIGSGMNSYNHSPYALVSEYFYRALAGIQLDEGFAADRRVTIDPTFVTDLEWAEGSVETPYGTVETSWERTDGAVDLGVTTPWNTTAAIEVAGERVAVDGVTVYDGEPTGEVVEGVESVTATDDGVSVVVAAGEYDVTVVE